MKLIFTSYGKTSEYDQPKEWLKRIDAYTGILEELAKQHEVISIERINYEGEYLQGGVRYYFVKTKNKVARFPFHTHKLIKAFKPRVVFINGFIFPIQIIQLRITLGRKPKIIILHRAEKPFTGLKKWFQKIADKCVDAYLFTSAEFGKEWIENGIISGPKKIYEVIQASSIFHPAERTSSRQALNVSGSPVFLWVGRLDENKDPLTVVKGFICFLQSHPSAKLYMIYQLDKLLPELESILDANAQARASIKLVGKISHEQLQNWYNSADFIISGSHYEGSGVAVAEAMSCGCIPILTNIFSFRKMTGPAKCGLLYEAGNDQELFETLLKTMEFDIAKEREKTLQQFHEELSFEAISRKINEVIESI